MTVDQRKQLTPQQMIAQLFAETQDGKIRIEYRPFLDQPYTMTYEVDWNAQDAQRLVERYDRLAAALERIGQLGKDPAQMETLLSGEDLEVWNIYLRPFEPFEVDEETVDTLYFRRETETLDDEEYDILERHYQWFLRNSRDRLPFLKCSPAFVVNRAQRYVELVKMGAPAALLREEGRNLAEEMVLYYHGPQRSQENP